MCNKMLRLARGTSARAAWRRSIFVRCTLIAAGGTWKKALILHTEEGRDKRKPLHSTKEIALLKDWS